MASNGKSFLIRPMKSEDVDEVARLFTSSFNEREPVVSHLKLGDEFMGKEFTEDCSKEGVSFVCLDTTRAEGDKIVGFRLCQTMKNPGVESDLDENSEFNKMDAFLSIVVEYENAFFAKHSNDTKCLLLFSLGVKDGYENLKIGSKLMEYAINHAKISGYEYCFSISSAPATQHMFSKKYNFTTVISRKYEDFVYKGNHFLKGITLTKELIGFELDLNEWDIALHQVPTAF